MAPRRAAALRDGDVSLRDHLIAAATRLIADRGTAGLTVRDIARAADVAVGVLYNHFADKEELFRTVILESAEQVREAQLADLDRHLGKIVDLEEDLIALGLAFVEVMRRFSAHFSLVRQINAEVGHIPEEILKAWQQTGPDQVQAGLSQHLKALSEKGLLEIENPQRATIHFVALVGSEIQGRTFYGAQPMDEEEAKSIVEEGVRVFLRAYAPK